MFATATCPAFFPSAAPQWSPQPADFGSSMARMGGPSPMEQMMGMQMQMNSMVLSMMTLLLELMMGRMGNQGGLANQGLSPNAASGFSGGASGSPLVSSGGDNVNGSSGVGTAGSTATATGTGKVAEFIQDAKSHVGAPYVFGAAGPKAFDCSGLVYYSLRQAGVNVPRLTADGYMNMFKSSRVSKDQLQPGDLIFYHSANNRGIGPGHATHIEVYLGNGMSMGTDNPSEGARIEPVNWSTFIGGARVPQLQQG